MSLLEKNSKINVTGIIIFEKKFKENSKSISILTRELGVIPVILRNSRAKKNMLGNLENIGYCTKGTESLYNIFIMEEVQTIVALGCGGVTKTVDRETDRIERIFNVKEPKDYIERIEEMLKRKDFLRIGNAR